MPYIYPAPDRPGPARRAGFSLVELIVVLAIMATLFALLLAAVQQTRGAAGKIRCANNLRNIALALHMHHDDRRSFPAGASIDGGRSPTRQMGWQAPILPYLERDALWQTTVRAYQQDPFCFHNPPHVGLATLIPTYQCPADGRVDTLKPIKSNPYGVALTSYLGVAGTNYQRLDGLIYTDSQTRLTDVVDGASNTLLVGERPPSAEFDYGWWYAGAGQLGTGSCDMFMGTNELNVGGGPHAPCPAGPYEFAPGSVTDACATYHFWSLHTGGAHFAFADGAVRFLTYSAGPVLGHLATRHGQEVAEY